MAKLLFWSFVAGFSERFVPQIINRVADQVEEDERQKGKSGSGKRGATAEEKETAEDRAK